jgi:hypothetical protein
MGKSRDWMYSSVEAAGQGSMGYRQTGAGQDAIRKFEF